MATKDDIVVIESADENSMTLNINGEVKTIQNQLNELKELLKTQNVSNITYENKVYNIEHINEANFGVVTSHKVFNGILTKDLIQLLSDKTKPGVFLSCLPPEDLENLEGSEYLNDAQNILVESFVWVIGWELRRLFAIGNDKEQAMEVKIRDYIEQCCTTYRISLQMVNYLLISKLWDEKNKNPNLDTNKPSLRSFFIAGRWLKLSELRRLFQDLLEIFKTNNLPLPIDDAALDVNEFMQNEGAFNKACVDLENLKAMEKTTPYGLGHCHTAEITLTAILKGFKFFSNYQLHTLKRIEYEEARNSPARYIKDLNILEGMEANDPARSLVFDKEPSVTYTVFFSNVKNRVSLFPFLLDYNALTGEADFQIYFYECREGDSDLRYYSIKNERKEVISYRATEMGTPKIRSEQDKIELLKNIRLDLVAKQFESAMNTLLGTDLHFIPK